ncbi:BatA domain-containing protein [Bacteroidales bacterium OttesenSCG-928-C03]|nr:BatA domain-containing protein [Bacteroidales bacterium OttesenSCG-928-C03]
MHFANPHFLYGLFLIVIPIIIHLFNFRRYKTIYFSNIKLLQNILKKTKKESQLQHLVVLFFRIMGITALVLAFAQPYIPKDEQITGDGKLVSIFVDNSYSMEANSKEGSVLYDAVDAARNIVSAFNFTDEFILITNDFSAKESSILNKDEILLLLDEIEISTNSQNLSAILSFEQNVAARANNSEKISYLISDFQKRQFDFENMKLDSISHYFLVQMPSQQSNNVSVDSCWFTTPVFLPGQQVDLTARISNYGNSEVYKLPVRLYVNDQQRALISVDLKPNSYADVQMNYTVNAEGIQRGYIQIDDTPITFDDQLFFTYNVKSSANVVIIEEKNAFNTYLRAMYGKDSIFNYFENYEDQVNYALFANAQLIVLDQLKSLSSGLKDELEKYVVNGGNLLVFPNADLNAENWNPFLSRLEIGGYSQLVEQELKAIFPDVENVYYKGSVTRSDVNTDMPVILKHFALQKSSGNPSQSILKLENGDDLLNFANVGKGKVFLASVALADEFGQAHKHALFFIPLHNIGIKSMMQSDYYTSIGQETVFTVSENARSSEELFTVKSRQDNFEFIPEQRSIGNEAALYFHDQIKNAGFYDVIRSNDVLASLAFNSNRKESDLTCYSEKEIYKMAEEHDANLAVIDGSANNLSSQVATLLKGTPLWRYFILIALCSFLVEILLLRFWGRAKVK